MQSKFIDYVEKVFFPRIVESFNKSGSGDTVNQFFNEAQYLDSTQIVTAFCLASFDCVDLGSDKFKTALIKYLKEVS